MSLKPVEMLARPPLTDIRERLRLLANEWDDNDTSIVIVCWPSGAVLGFGDALTRAEVIGTLFSAARDFGT